MISKMLVGLSTLILVGGADATAVTATPQYLKLVDTLDRPQDGYCFDVQGVAGNFRADKPLVAHNCKPGAAPDGLIKYTADNKFLFTAFNQCMTAMGTGNTVLPGASLMIKPCVEQGPFASWPVQKTFSFNKNKQIELTGSKLCVVVGETSAHTVSRYDRWRTLYLDYCETTPLARSQWEFINP